jgi:hypothetical protein
MTAPSNTLTTEPPARRPRFRRSLLKMAALTTSVAVAAVSTLVMTGTQAGAATSGVEISTLGTSPVKAQQEYDAGMRVAMMEISWRNWEPAKGTWSAGYEREMKERLAALKNAGMKVTLGLGLHFAPTWAYSLPNSKFISQDGKVSSELNLVFNQNLRSEADDFLKRAGEVLGYDNFDSIRVTSGSRSEVLYPSGNTYWGFDANALGGSALPSTMRANPLPGWKPGTAGKSTAEMTDWANWYIDSLADSAAWQIRTVRGAGFTGSFEIMSPGVGVYARKLSTVVSQNVPTSSPLAVGALWDRMYADLAKVDTKLVANISSMADGSGGNDSCSPTDKDLAITDANTVWWGGARWISFLADKYGFGKVGENPGYLDANKSKYTDPTAAGYMQTTMRQASSCGFKTIYWAHDDQFWNGTLNFATWAAFAPARGGAAQQTATTTAQPSVSVEPTSKAATSTTPATATTTSGGATVTKTVTISLIPATCAPTTPAK